MIKRVAGVVLQSRTAVAPERGAEFDRVGNCCCVVRGGPVEGDVIFTEGIDYGIGRLHRHWKKEKRENEAGVSPNQPNLKDYNFKHTNGAKVTHR